MSQQPISPEVLCQDVIVMLGRFKSTLADVAEAHGLTAMQLGALHAIREGSVTMGRVAQSMHCDASNVTGIVDRLVSLGMVTRQESAQDRRVKTLSLTDQGQKIMQEITTQLPERLGCTRLSGIERSNAHQAMLKMFS